MINFLAKKLIKKHEDVEDATVRSKYGILTSIIGIFCNILLFAGKLIAGILSGAISIIADALNNLTDAASSVVSMLGFKLSNRPNDAEHPFGHGRIEYIAGFIVSMLIIFVGFELIKTSVEKIISPSPISITLFTIIVLSVSILVKLWMFFYNNKISKKIKSATIKAVAIDSISDVLATLVVLISAIVNYYTQIIIDGYIGILVALFIFYAGTKSIKEIISLLLGTKPDKDFVKAIADFVLSYEGILGIHDLVVHNYGPGRQMISLHAEVPCDVDILTAHDLIDNIEFALMEKFLCHAVIHMDPLIVNDERITEIRTLVEQIVKDYNEEYSIHDFRMNDGNTHSNLIFDMVTTYDKKLSDEKIISDIKTRIKALNKNFNAVITIDKPFI